MMTIKIHQTLKYRVCREYTQYTKFAPSAGSAALSFALDNSCFNAQKTEWYEMWRSNGSVACVSILTQRLANFEFNAGKSRLVIILYIVVQKMQTASLEPTIWVVGG